MALVAALGQGAVVPRAHTGRQVRSVAERARDTGEGADGAAGGVAVIVATDLIHAPAASLLSATR